jgi:hypothetical protein
MTGPVKTQTIWLGQGNKQKQLWIKKFKVETLNESGAQESNEFLCHAWGTVSDQGDEKFTISQGLSEMVYPDGYAMRVENQANNFNLLVQALNNGQGVNKTLQYRFTISYYEDDPAPFGIKELHLKTVSVIDPKYSRGSSGSVKPGNGKGKIERYPRDPVHFDVPRGRHEYRTSLEQESYNQKFSSNTVVHFIKLHLHPYGQSVELRDKTANKTVWKGYAKNAVGRPAILETEDYSSAEGIKIFKDHDYEVITVYDNKSGKVIDAMAVLRIYAE